MSRAQQRQRLMDELEHLAFTAEREETQLVAAVAWLDRFEGKPIARSIAAGSDDLAALDDAALAGLAADLADQLRASSSAEES